jgi:hypothetical protein
MPFGDSVIMSPWEAAVRETVRTIEDLSADLDAARLGDGAMYGRPASVPSQSPQSLQPNQLVLGRGQRATYTTVLVSLRC